MTFFNSRTAIICLIGIIPLTALAADPVPQPSSAEIQGEASRPSAPAIPVPVVPVPTAQEKGAAPQIRQFRIGYVDMARLRQESDKGKSLSAQAQERRKKLQSQIDTRRRQIEKQKASLEGKLASLTPVQREAKAREFQKKVEEFQNFGLKSEKELQELQEKLLEELYKAIEAAASEYGRENGLELVIVKRELLYLATGVDTRDVTDGVLALLNRK